MQQKLIYAAVIVLVVGGAILGWSMYKPANNANFPEGTDWLCMNKSCGTHFKLTVAQQGEHYKKHYGKRPLCTKCGQESVRAEVCGHCAKVYPQARGVQICPYCKKEQFAKPA